MAELSEKYVKTSESHLLGEGKFRKQGELLKLWKVRNYKVFDDGILISFDPATDASTNIYNLSQTTFADADIKYVEKSGAPREGVALSVHCFKVGKLDLVLDSVKEAEDFVTAVGQVNLANASEAQNFAVSHRWHESATRLEEEIERFEEEEDEEEYDYERAEDSDDENSDDNSEDLDNLNVAEPTGVREGTFIDVFNDPNNTILCAGRFLKQNSFKKSCNVDEWKERRFSLNKEGELTYSNRLGFDNNVNIGGCIIRFHEIEVVDVGEKPIVVLAVELLVAKSSNKSVCLTFDVENKECNLKRIDDFVNVLRTACSVVIANQSVRGKKVKKEKEQATSVTAEDHTTTALFFISGMIFVMIHFAS